MFGLIILGVLVLTAIFADQIATHDPYESLLGAEAGVTARAAPCIHLLGCPADQPQHILGTDSNFRDVFSRVVFGARTSLVIGLAAIGFAIFVGSTIGALAGYMSGWTDNIVMRLMDVILAFPSLLLAIIIVTAAGPSLVNALIAIGIVAIPVYARVARASVLSSKENDYVTASRALGESTYGVLVRRIMPNSITPLVVTGHAGHRRRGPRDRGPGLRRRDRRHPAARMGLDDRPRTQPAVQRAVDDPRAGHRHHPDRARVQPPRRRTS